MLKKGLKTLLVISMLLGIGGVGTLSAGEKTNTKQISPEALKAAYELFDVLKLKEGLNGTLQKSLEVQLKRQPAMRPYKDIYEKYFQKYGSWNGIKKAVAILYARAFTTEELKQLTRFYSSKVGKKALVYMPRLSEVMIMMAQKRIAAHADELKKEIAQRAKELEQKEKK